MELNLTHYGSSFYDFMRLEHGYLLPRFHVAEDITAVAYSQLPHGTTILALKYREGVIVAADRQATEGYQVASRRTRPLPSRGLPARALRWSSYFK